MGRCGPAPPQLTAGVRLPVVVFSTERHAVEVGTLLLSEITGPCRTGLRREEDNRRHSRQERFLLA